MCVFLGVGRCTGYSFEGYCSPPDEHNWKNQWGQDRWFDGFPFVDEFVSFWAVLEPSCNRHPKVRTLKSLVFMMHERDVPGLALACLETDV